MVNGFSFSASADEPEMRTGTVLPSTFRRSDRHVPGSCAGTGGSCRPGMPSSAIPTGVTTDFVEYWLGRLTASIDAIFTSTWFPVTAGNRTTTGTTPFLFFCTGSSGSAIHRT